LLLRLAAAALRRQPAIVDRAVELFNVPLEQGFFDALEDAERALQQGLQAHRGLRQLQPAQVIECAVDDGVGAGVEEFQIDVAEQPLQIDIALRVAQRDVQHLVRDEADLFVERPLLEALRIEQRVAIGGYRWCVVIVGRALVGRQIVMTYPQREAAGGRRELDHALHRSQAAVLVGLHDAPSLRRRSL
jgi:hypothetical protein